MDTFELIISPIHKSEIKVENFAEVKAYIEEKTETYKNVYYSNDQKDVAKGDRATLNKLLKTISDMRIAKKKEYLASFNKLEEQLKELEGITKDAVAQRDAQVKVFEEEKKAEKRKKIEELFAGMGFQSFVTLEKIWDPKWLNASTSMKSIEEQMRSRMYEIGDNVLRISQFPEFSFEAMEAFKETLLIDTAVDVVQKNREMEQKKAAAKAAEEARKAEEERKAQDIKEELIVPSEPVQSELKFPVRFEAIVTEKQGKELKLWFAERNIEFKAI